MIKHHQAPTILWILAAGTTSVSSKMFPKPTQSSVQLIPALSLQQSCCPKPQTVGHLPCLLRPDLPTETCFRDSVGEFFAKDQCSIIPKQGVLHNSTQFNTVLVILVVLRERKYFFRSFGLAKVTEKQPGGPSVLGSLVGLGVQTLIPRIQSAGKWDGPRTVVY